MRPLDLVVVGGGVAGLAAADEAVSQGLAVALFESGLYGGLVSNVGALDGWPAAVSGSELAHGWKDRLAAAGVRFHEEHVEAVRAQGRRRIVETDRGRYRAKAVVAATGARLRRLGVPGEEELTGRGVSQCAFCDAGFFRDADVAVVGGGDAALQEALHLAGYARSIAMIVRSGRLRARRGYGARAAADPKFSFHWNSEVASIDGEGGVEGVTLADGRRLEVSGVFVFIGLEPVTALAGEGVFAAGAVHRSGSLAEAVADGQRAAREAAAALRR